MVSCGGGWWLFGMVVVDGHGGWWLMVALGSGGL